MRKLQNADKNADKVNKVEMHADDNEIELLIRELGARSGGKVRPGRSDFIQSLGNSSRREF